MSGVTPIILVVALLLASPASADTRHAATVRAFQRLTGYPHGRPGFVVDHIVPLCAGGADAVRNLQWQATAASYQKDVFERRLCAALRAQGYRLVKVTP